MNQNKPCASPTTPWPKAKSPWERIHLDFLDFEGVTYLMVVDAFSKWPEVFKMTVTTSTATIEKLRFLFAAYDLPKIVVSDNGPQLVSSEFKSFMNNNGITHQTSAAYKARQNGQAEKFAQIFKNFLRRNRNISLNIARFLFSYRNTPNSVTGKFPSMLFLNRQVRSKFSLILPHSS